MIVRQVDWYPASGEPPLTIPGERIRAIAGIESVETSPLTLKSPSQAGETAVDTQVAPRVVTLQHLVDGVDEDAIAALRRLIARKMVGQPVRAGEDLQLGRLVITPRSGSPVDAEAVPRGRAAVIDVEGGSPNAIADLEWICPSPYWRDITDSFALLESSGGFDFTVEFPLEMPTNNIQLEIDNAGDVDTPILARLYGDVTTARLRNLTTGEEIEISGQITADQYVEIDTSFGGKRIELVTISTGARSSIFNRLNLAKADFWQLRPGLNLVRFEADTNLSGQATVHWRQRYAGI